MSTSLRYARALTIAFFLANAFCRAYAAEDHYPSKPARMIVTFGAGATTDTSARIFASKLSEVWGQQLIVENRPGAGGVMGMDSVAKATPDGYTLAFCGIGQTIAAALYKKLPYDHLRDFSPVSLIATLPNILVVNPSMPASVRELVNHAKANPGKLKYASSGIGSSSHLTMELFKSTAGVDILHVPYKSMVQGVIDLVGGDLNAAFLNLPGQLSNVRAGRVRGLAVTSARRSEELPNVPTMIEAGFPGFEVTVWQGLCAPAGTPKAVIAKLHGAVITALKAPDLRQRFAGLGMDAAPTTPEEFAAFIRAETLRWTKAARAAGTTEQ